MKRWLLLLILLAAFSRVPAIADEEGHDRHTGQTKTQLGKVHFPTTCAKAVRAEFESGVAMLHSFW